MLNAVVSIGRLVSDPQLRYTQDGIAVISFTVEVNCVFATKDGQKKTHFVNIKACGKQAETCANHLTKGSLVAVRGNSGMHPHDNNGVELGELLLLGYDG